MAVAAWNLWCLMGQWVVRRVVWVVGLVLVLACSQLNAAAHGLSLARRAELILFGINLTLFALVHLAVWLNKYILPHWFHRGRAMAKELASGTVDRDGRAAASMTRERNKLLLALERASRYRDYLAVAARLDRLPADLGEGGDEWRGDEQTTDGYDAALCRIYLTVMRQAREKGDAAALGLALRTVLHRNFGGVDRLFRLRGARAGTKRTAEEFVQELERAITFLGEAGTPAYDAATSGSGPGRGGGDPPSWEAPPRTARESESPRTVDGTRRRSRPEDGTRRGARPSPRRVVWILRGARRTAPTRTFARRFVW